MHIRRLWVRCVREIFWVIYHGSCVWEVLIPIDKTVSTFLLHYYYSHNIVDEEQAVYYHSYKIGQFQNLRLLSCFIGCQFDRCNDWGLFNSFLYQRESICIFIIILIKRGVLQSHSEWLKLIFELDFTRLLTARD